MYLYFQKNVDLASIGIFISFTIVYFAGFTPRLIATSIFVTL